MNDKSSRRSRFLYRGLAFVAVQVAVVVVVIGVTLAKRDPVQRSRFVLPPMRDVPLDVRPLYDRPDFVSDEQLAAVLYKLRPRLADPEPKINHVDHALRFWGVEAEFDDPQCLSGRQMHDMLLNHDHFCKAWPEEEEPFLVPNEHCVGIRTKDGKASASHDDHTLAGLAEVGTPLDMPILTHEGPATMRDILEASLRVFDLQQVEYEWSSLAYVLYIESMDGWRDVNGQEVSFDRLAERMMRERRKLGVCYGNHRLHTLVIFLRVDEVHPILSPACRQRVIEHLKGTTEVLVASQDPAGYWNQYWAMGERPVPDDALEQALVDAQGRRILATGHTLEWWAFAPQEILPPDDVIERAAGWVSQEVVGMDDDEVRKKYTFLSHVGRAVALWRGDFPARFLPLMEARHN